MKAIARTCRWCGRWVLGIGHEVNGQVYCSWAHYLAWLSQRGKED